MDVVEFEKPFIERMRKLREAQQGIDANVKEPTLYPFETVLNHLNELATQLLGEGKTANLFQSLSSTWLLQFIEENFIELDEEGNYRFTEDEFKKAKDEILTIIEPLKQSESESEMNTYCVPLKIVGRIEVVVEANSSQEAVEKAKECATIHDISEWSIVD